MDDYLIVKSSQINMFKDVPLYYQSQEDSYTLYKKKGEILDQSRLDETKHPDLFIRKDDKKKAVNELFSTFNTILSGQCMSKELKAVRSTLYLIVNEALESPEKEVLEGYLPETIEILFNAYGIDTQILEVLGNIKNSSDIIIEHTINVLIITLRYCFFHQIPENETKQLALCALLHDIGASTLDKDLIQSDQRLSDDEYKVYKNHTVKGFSLLKRYKGLDPAVSRVALEHHERVDGSGYPEGRTDICLESQIIGMIASYEPLTYRDKSFRKAKQPFDTLRLIKEEVLQGRFEQELFKKLCSSLGD